MKPSATPLAESRIDMAFDAHIDARTNALCGFWHLKYPSPVKERLASRQSTTKPVVLDIGGYHGTGLESFADGLPDLDCGG